MKKQNGITLIALIITIIVMLILVGVSVTVALKGGLFKTAQDAANNTRAERDNELAISNGDIIDKYLQGTGNGTISGTWTQNGEILTDGTTTLAIGDVATNFNAGGYDWALLGVDKNGKILLTTTTLLPEVTIKGLSAEDNGDGVPGALDGVDYLNSIFSDSTKSDWYINISGTDAESIRSINVDDLNRVTGAKQKTITITSDNEYYYDGNISTKVKMDEYRDYNFLANILGKSNGEDITGIASNQNNNELNDLSSEVVEFLFPGYYHVANTCIFGEWGMIHSLGIGTFYVYPSNDDFPYPESGRGAR